MKDSLLFCLAVIITLIFSVLKLYKIIVWPWWLVLSPILLWVVGTIILIWYLLKHFDDMNNNFD